MQPAPEESRATAVIALAVSLVCVQSCQLAADCQVVGQPQNLVVSVVLLNACKRRRIASALGV